MTTSYTRVTHPSADDQGWTVESRESGGGRRAVRLTRGIRTIFASGETIEEAVETALGVAAVGPVRVAPL